MPILRLPQNLVDQIAAGEVVERPASVLKELLENSLDAGATRIEVRVQGSGRRLLQVQDDGAGIPPEELLLAVQSHATSKIQSAEDLVAVGSYGFRGEALASIAAVSHLRLSSRVRELAEGGSIVVRGGVAEEARPEGRPPGTTVEVRDLFYNTPARRKFLKTDATELGHLIDAVLHLALARPDVEFVLETDARRSLQLRAGASLRERIAAGYGRELADALLEVQGGYAGLRVSGFVAPPSHARARSAVQSLTINGRFVHDRTVQGAVRRAFSDFLAESLRPTYFLFLEIDPAQVDCNVHPTKTEVRLRNSSDVYRVVLHGVERALTHGDLTPRFRAPGGTVLPLPPRPVAPSPVSGTAAGPGFVADPGASGSAAPVASAAQRELFEVLSGPAPARALPRLVPGRYVQVLNTYLVMATEEGLLLLDQHALHERVLYRNLREEWRGRALRRQELLTPLRVELDARDVLLLEEAGELLESVGIRLAPFGPTEVAVSAVPAAVGTHRVDRLIARLAEFLRGERPEGRLDDFLDRMLFTMACHRAVRAGDPLGDAQIQSLLEEAGKIEHSHTCPHGRPTRVLVPVAELENLFKRRGF